MVKKNNVLFDKELVQSVFSDLQIFFSGLFRVQADVLTTNQEL